MRTLNAHNSVRIPRGIERKVIKHSYATPTTTWYSLENKDKLYTISFIKQSFYAKTHHLERHHPRRVF